MHGLVDRLDPKNDLVFKLLLTYEPALLRDMLEAILGRPVRDATVLNPGIPGELPRDKQIALDIRARLGDGSRADVEMQVRLVPALAARLVYYATRDYAAQLGRGDDYELLTPTVVVAWLVDPLLPDLERLHAIFELRERHTHHLLTDQLQIHLLQLSALSSSGSAVGYADPRVERWARFFMMAQDDAELDRLAAEDPIMALARKTLDQLSQDPETRRLAREREDSLALYRMHLAASHAEGKVEGEAKVLLKQLGYRFGPLSNAIRARVEAATVAQLDAWVERVLTAATLDEVFAR
jgi:predicted transposase/invertase (TIGR01784 family)